MSQLGESFTSPKSFINVRSLIRCVLNIIGSDSTNQQCPNLLPITLYYRWGDFVDVHLFIAHCPFDTFTGQPLSAISFCYISNLKLAFNVLVKFVQFDTCSSLIFFYKEVNNRLTRITTSVRSEATKKYGLIMNRCSVVKKRKREQSWI